MYNKSFDKFEELINNNIFYVFNEDELILLLNYIIYIKEHNLIEKINKFKLYETNLCSEYHKMLQILNKLNLINNKINIVVKISFNFNFFNSVLSNYLI